jgi:hypothetical protein
MMQSAVSEAGLGADGRSGRISPAASRGSRTVLGARGGKSPPRDSTKSGIRIFHLYVAFRRLRTLPSLVSRPAGAGYQTLISVVAM